MLNTPRIQNNIGSEILYAIFVNQNWSQRVAIAIREKKKRSNSMYAKSRSIESSQANDFITCVNVNKRRQFQSFKIYYIFKDKQSPSSRAKNKLYLMSGRIGRISDLVWIQRIVRDTHADIANTQPIIRAAKFESLYEFLVFDNGKGNWNEYWSPGIDAHAKGAECVCIWLRWQFVEIPIST